MAAITKTIPLLDIQSVSHMEKNSISNIIFPIINRCYYLMLIHYKNNYFEHYKSNPSISIILQKNKQRSNNFNQPNEEKQDNMGVRAEIRIQGRDLKSYIDTKGIISV